MTLQFDEFIRYSFYRRFLFAPLESPKFALLSYQTLDTYTILEWNIFPDFFLQMRLSVRFYKHCVFGSTSKNQKIWAEEALSDGIFRISRYSLKPLKNESSWRDQRPCTPSALSCASILCGKKSCSSMLSISVWYYCPPKYILCYSSVVSLKRYTTLSVITIKKMNTSLYSVCLECEKM